DKPELGAGDAWDKIAAAQQVIAANAARYNYLESYYFNSALYKIARDLVRVASDRTKPNGDRLPEYRDSAKNTPELALFSAKPIHPEVEQIKIQHFLTLMAMELGANDPAVKLALGGKSPAVRAAELVNGTKVLDIEARKALYGKTPEEIAKADDAMVQLALALDPAARAVRKTIDQQGEAKQQAHARIAKVRYAKDGDRVSPDATFTLRLSYGAVKGITAGGEKVAPYTTLGGIFERAADRGNVPPYDLPESWSAAKAKLDLNVPFNFIATCYSIGGNSGSPVINRAGEFIGIIFDGNIDTLVWNYAFSDTRARSVSVDVRGIIEAMRKVYGADALVSELVGKK
ncbi:MAG TPA: S46 family peptidase, partial [Acidobacteriota bacterium]|nr:S46 family peptidase [Acidobacteriota bacterium]